VLVAPALWDRTIDAPVHSNANTNWRVFSCSLTRPPGPAEKKPPDRPTCAQGVRKDAPTAATRRSVGDSTRIGRRDSSRAARLQGTAAPSSDCPRTAESRLLRPPSRGSS
jgi:hypothetical protein